MAEDVVHDGSLDLVRSRHQGEVGPLVVEDRTRILSDRSIQEEAEDRVLQQRAEDLLDGHNTQVAHFDGRRLHWERFASVIVCNIDRDAREEGVVARVVETLHRLQEDGLRTEDAEGIQSFQVEELRHWMVLGQQILFYRPFCQLQSIYQWRFLLLQPLWSYWHAWEFELGWHSSRLWYAMGCHRRPLWSYWYLQ
jgi:hypothetical protein